MSRFLTKSLFTLALECPTKLFYTKKDKKYANKKIDDPFLEALAEGGFQVGELAKLYHPGGHEIKEIDSDMALARTKVLLKQDQVTIFEGAFNHENLFIRVDILVKNGKNIDLIEVKAKSTNFRDHFGFLNAKGDFLQPKWTSYLYDVAFQKHVLQNSFPDWNIRSYLMLADKNSVASVDGLNQRFRINSVKEGGRSRTVVEVMEDPGNSDLGDEILIKINVDRIVEMIFNNRECKVPHAKGFTDRIQQFSDSYQNDVKIIYPIGTHCKDCEYKATEEEEHQGLISGFKECWRNELGWTDDDFLKPHIFDLWNYRGKNEMLNQNKHFLRDLVRSDIGQDRSFGPGLSVKYRQWLQVEKAINNDHAEYFDVEGLKNEMESWKFPLHFIDFETAALAIPFYKGMKPYEGVCFQFSHHTVHQDGSIKHAGQYLNTELGKFPNFEFLKELKKQLEGDDGTIFRYADHENTYLNIIYSQLGESSILGTLERDELCSWIKTITHSSSDQADKWTGIRDMIDLRKLVVQYYYNPFTKGSNSLKAVLPAVLNSSQYLQEKYSKPIYGSENGIPSFNYKDQIWIHKDSEGHILDPYKLLPPLFLDIDVKTRALFLTDDQLAEGGAAMTAYAKMQFSDMSAEERDGIVKGLLRYCELDTFAMVLVWEHWHNLIY